MEDCARTLKEICRTFVITCGKSGSLTFDGKEVTRADGIATQAVDTTGAGDIFAGAFLHSLCQGQGFTEAAQLANRSASLLVSSFGARLSQDEVDTNLK